MSGVTQQREDRGALESELRQAGAEIRGPAFRCPGHDDRHASGSIYCDTDGIWRAKCHVCGFGGDVFDIRAHAQSRPVGDVLSEASGSTWRPAERIYADLGALRQAVEKAGQIEGEYAYENPDTGRTDLLVFRLRSADGKQFRQAHPVSGGWVQRAPAKPWPLYRRVEIRGARGVVIVEGEKAADALNAIGIAATTSPCGAGKAEHADWTPVAGKRVWLWPDNDDPGRAHMKQVAAILEKLEPAAMVRLIDPSDLDLQAKEDAFDFIEQCRVAGMDPKQAVVDVVGKARSCSVSSGLWEEIEATIDGRLRDIPWPWRGLAGLTWSQLPHCVTVLCGSPGAAKSFMLLTSLVAWFEDGVPIAHLALEKDRTYWLRRVLALHERNVELLNPEYAKAHPDTMRDAYGRQREFLDRFGKRIWDSPAKTLSLAEVASWIRERAIEGNRIITVDPVTATVASERAWVADTEFVNAVRAIVLAFDVSLLLVTHPRKGSRGANLDDLAGGAVYQRLSDTVLWIEKHDGPKSVTVQGDCGRFEVEIDQTVHVCKSRGPGHKKSLGFKINWPTLEFAEQGVIFKAARSRDGGSKA